MQCRVEILELRPTFIKFVLNDVDVSLANVSVDGTTWANLLNKDIEDKKKNNTRSTNRKLRKQAMHWVR